MLTNVVGRTGSGKTLLASYLIYDECTRIMRGESKKPLWFFGQWTSYYKRVAIRPGYRIGSRLRHQKRAIQFFACYPKRANIYTLASSFVLRQIQ